MAGPSKLLKLIIRNDAMKTEYVDYVIWEKRV
jgi:hypothetical protein